MTRRTLLHTAAFLPLCLFTTSKSLIPHTSFAATPTQTVTAGNSAPHLPVQELYNALQQAETHGSTPAKRTSFISPAVNQAFDMDVILRHSVGLHYEKLTADERSQLLRAFQDFTVARYASTFKPGTDAIFSITPTPQPNTTGGVIIHTTVRGKNDEESEATPLDYIMQQGPQGWRITDILLDGHISQVAAQRSDFRAIFTKGGASALTQTLSHKADLFLHE